MRKVAAYACLAGSLGCIILFWSGLFDRHLVDLPLGSIHLPTPGYRKAMSLWLRWGGLASLLAIVAFTLLLRPQERESKQPPNDRRFVALATVAAFAIPAGVRLWVLQGSPLVDDEAIYRFAAQLISSGRLETTSPPGELFWDRVFMVNDGRWFTQYFLGWPALMTPFLAIGAEGFANAFYAGLGAPAVYLFVRQTMGRQAAKLAVGLYAISPLLVFAAATKMSHTSCVAANAWTAWFYLKTTEDSARWWHHAGLAILFSIGIFIRPLTTLGLSAPFVLLWCVDRIRRRKTSSFSDSLAFVAPAAAFAALFFWINHYYTGSVFHTAYQVAQEYAVQNEFRYSHLSPRSELVEWVNLRLDFKQGLFDSAVSLLRFNFAALGWPVSVLFLPLAARARGSALAWTMFVSFLAFHFFMRHSGVDTFGPPHHTELTLPLVMLTAGGLMMLTHELPIIRRIPERIRRTLPVTCCAALVATSLLGYTALRIYNLGRIADAVRLPEVALEQAMATRNTTRAIVFRHGFYAHPCMTFPTRSFVFWPPMASPDLQDDVLWVNHLTYAADKTLHQKLGADRTPLVAFWSGNLEKNLCRLQIEDLERVGPRFPPSRYVTADYRYTP